MSDAYGQEEYEMEWPEDGDENEGWGSDGQGGDDGEVTPAVEVENLYYEAEGRMKDEPKEALEQLEKAITLEENIGDEIKHRFKAIEFVIILCARLKDYDKMMSFHTKCLSLVTKVARNDVSDTINNIVDAGMRHLENQPEYQRKIFQTSLDVLKDSNQ